MNSDTPDPGATQERRDGTATALRRVAFFVPGRPRPQGSKRAVLRRLSSIEPSNWTGDARVAVHMREQSRHVGNWRARIATVALSVRGGSGLIGGPVRVSLHFYYARPKSHYHKSKRRANALREDAPRFPTSRNYGDTEKLIRACHDALTSVLWVDDSQAVRVSATKAFVHHGKQDGVAIEIEEIA